MGLQATAQPTTQAVSLTEAKQHLRVESTFDDTQIEALIDAAQEWVESYTTRRLVQTEYRWTISGFPGKASESLRLPLSPVSAVDLIEYTDGAGNTQTFTDFQADLDVDPSIILPGQGGGWPSAANDTLDAVKVDFTAGYASDADVPRSLKQAMLLLIGHWYEHREAVSVGNTVTELPQAVVFLSAPYRVRFF